MTGGEGWETEEGRLGEVWGKRGGVKGERRKCGEKGEGGRVELRVKENGKYMHLCFYPTSIAPYLSFVLCVLCVPVSPLFIAS